MCRRRFLARLGAAVTAPALRAFQPLQSNARKLKISAVEVWKVEGSRQAASGVNQQYQVNPLHVYDELRPGPYRDSPVPGTRTAAISALYLKIRTDQGLEGLYGPVDREAAI